MLGRRTTWCVLVAVGTLAACNGTSETVEPAAPAGDGSPEPTTTAVAETAVAATAETAPSSTPLPQEPPSTSTPDRCEDLVVLDEYGFPIEIERCETTDSGESSTIAAVLSRVPSDESRAVLDAGHEAASRLAAACGDPAAWSAEAERLLPGLDATIDMVTNDPELAEWLGGADARALADEFRELLVFPTECDGGSPLDAGIIDIAFDTAGRVAGANDDLTFALDDPNQIVFASDFWYATDQLGHLVDTSIVRETQPIDVLLMGASTVKRGIDPVQLGDEVGRTVYNAAVGALAPDLQLSWYRELRGSEVAAGTVVIGLNTWIEFLPCESPQKDRVAETDARRARAFDDIGALATAPGGRRLVGGDPPSYAGRALTAHRATWPPNTGGRLELSDGYEQGVADNQAEQFRTLLDDELCTDRLDRIELLAAEIVADGSDLVLVVLPTSDAVVGFHPDGRAGHDLVVERYRTIADTTGSRLLDLSELADETLYVDLTHLGNAGRALVTDALATFLSGAAT